MSSDNIIGKTFFGLPVPGCSTVIMVFALCVAFFVLYTGNVEEDRNAALRERGVTVEGVVIAGRVETDGDMKSETGEGTWLDVEYPTSNGRARRKQFRTSSVHHRIGDRISVTYLQDAPNDAILGRVPEPSSDHISIAAVAALVGLTLLAVKMRKALAARRKIQ